MAKKIIRLTETDLAKLVKRVIKEDSKDIPPCDQRTFSVMLSLIKKGDEFKLQNIPGDGQNMVIEIPNLYEPCKTPRSSVFK